LSLSVPHPHAISRPHRLSNQTINLSTLPPAATISVPVYHFLTRNKCQFLQKRKRNKGQTCRAHRPRAFRHSSTRPGRHRARQAEKKKKKKPHSLLAVFLSLIFLLCPVCSVLVGSAHQPPPQYKSPSAMDCALVPSYSSAQPWI
jgi:hypothetical protein